MPKRRFKRRRKRSGKTPYRRRKRVRRKTRMVRYRRTALPLNGFKRFHLTKHRYYQEFELIAPGIPAEVNATTYVFRANNIRDPNFTDSSPSFGYNTQHRPMGFDEMTAIYRQYSVVASDITCYQMDQGYTYVAPFGMYGITLRNEPFLPPVNQAELVEAGYNFKTARTTRAFQGGRGMTLRKKFNAKRFFKTNRIVGKEEFTQPTSVNSESSGEGKFNAYFILWAANVDQNQNTPAPAKFHCVINYYVLWSDKKVPVQSSGNQDHNNTGAEGPYPGY